MDNNFYLHNDQALLYDRQLSLLDKIALPTVNSRDKVRAIMEVTHLEDGEFRRWKHPLRGDR